nr:hypothetical protein [Tanacetum cinerariifolium]
MVVEDTISRTNQLQKAMFDQRTKEDTRKRMGSLNLKGILALSCIFSN